jgi:hypothetical protein
VVLGFGDSGHGGKSGPWDALREKTRQDNIYVWTIKKTGNMRSYCVSGKMQETISK